MKHWCRYCVDLRVDRLDHRLGVVAEVLAADAAGEVEVADAVGALDVRAVGGDGDDGRRADAARDPALAGGQQCVGLDLRCGHARQSPRWARTRTHCGPDKAATRDWSSHHSGNAAAPGEWWPWRSGSWVPSSWPPRCERGELSAVEALDGDRGARRRDRAPAPVRAPPRERPRRRRARRRAARRGDRRPAVRRPDHGQGLPLHGRRAHDARHDRRRALRPGHDRRRRAPPAGRRRGDLRQDRDARVLLRRHDARHAQPARPDEDARAAPPAAPRSRSPRAPDRSRSAATAAARSASRPRSAASSASSPRSARCRASRARRAGRRSSPTARSPAPSPTRAWPCEVLAGEDPYDRHSRDVDSLRVDPQRGVRTKIPLRAISDC